MYARLCVKQSHADRFAIATYSTDFDAKSPPGRPTFKSGRGRQQLPNWQCAPSTYLIHSHRLPYKLPLALHTFTTYLCKLLPTLYQVRNSQPGAVLKTPGAVSKRRLHGERREVIRRGGRAAGLDHTAPSTAESSFSIKIPAANAPQSNPPAPRARLRPPLSWPAYS